VNFIEAPQIDLKKLGYTTTEVYCNLFEIVLKKEIKLYQYPYKVANIESGDTLIRSKLFNSVAGTLKSIYGEFFVSGDLFYSMKPIEESKTFSVTLYHGGKTEYNIEINKFIQVRTIKQEDVQKDQLAKQIIEMIIRDILKANPKVEFYKDIFVLEGEKIIYDEYEPLMFCPGFLTSFVETKEGNFLNVALKNKIYQTQTLYDYVTDNNYTRKEISDYLQGRTFRVTYSKKKYKIFEICFDKNPQNTNINYDGKTHKLYEYYRDVKKLPINHLNQPLIKIKNSNAYFIPEFCTLTGLEEEWTQDKNFMDLITKKTKLEPNERVTKTNEFMKLLKEDASENNIFKEKIKNYGLEIKPMKKLFKAYHMKEPKLITGDDEEISVKEKFFDVYEKSEMLNWACFFEEKNKNAADDLYKALVKASKSYGLTVGKPNMVKVKNNYNEDWKTKVNKMKYDFVVFIINNDQIYGQIKKHSICENGYISQVVKASTIFKKKSLLSICSKILLQINAKLGGMSYVLSLKDPLIQKMNLMVIGATSSHVKGHGTGVAMVATINESFTKFYNEKQIIKEQNNKEVLEYKVIGEFIESAFSAYKKENNNKVPKGIIIYRQGVSLQQKELLDTEVSLIDDCCKTKGLKYYYILVNTKTNYKFFEKEKKTKNYMNPESGLLVMDSVTNKNFFEFYIQPQKVTQGSATPTCFHVAFGNLEIPEVIPKFTYDLCYIYSNWQGPVRIPNVLKAAEKLSKLTSKYNLDKLNDKLKIGQAYL
jgi:aubergine-like protein